MRAERPPRGVGARRHCGRDLGEPQLTAQGSLLLFLFTGNLSPTPLRGFGLFALLVWG